MHPNAAQWSSLAGALVLWAGLVLTGPSHASEDPSDVGYAVPPLTESQQDHADAVALYAHGRVLVQRGSQLEGDARTQALSEALRCIQRAWWLDHDLASITEDILPLAYALKHGGEAVRYCVIAARQPDAAPERLREVVPELFKGMAMDLARRNSFEDSLTLYAKYQQLASQRGDPPDVAVAFEIGRLSLLLGKFDDAAAAFATVRDALDNPEGTTLAPDDRAALLRSPEITYALMGESFLRANRLDEAEAMFRRAEEAKPNAAMLGLRLALIEKARGNRDRALQELEPYFSAKTTSGGMAPYQVLEWALSGVDAAGPAAAPAPPSEEVLTQLKRLAEHDPHNAFLGYFLADRLRAAMRWEEAIAQYRAMLAVEPAADGHQGLVEIFIRQQQLAPLLDQLGEVVDQTGSLLPLGASIDPLATDRALLERLSGVMQARLADDAAGASPGAVMAMALLEAKGGTVERAESYWHEALRHPAPAAGQFAVNYALYLLERGEGLRAAAALEHVLDEKLLPDRDAELHFYLAGAWSLGKEYTKALAAARAAAKLEPHSARMAARAPWVLYQAKRLDEADQAYRAIIDRFGADYGSEETRQVLHDIRFVLSAIQAEQDRLAEAEEWLRQVLDEYPEDIGALNDLGYLWCDQGQHLERSLAMVRTAVQAEPANTAYRDSLGWALYRLGRYTEALEELQRAAAADDADGVIFDHLGDAHLQLGQVPAAIDAWRKAAAAFQQQDDVKRLARVQDKLGQHAAP